MAVSTASDGKSSLNDNATITLLDGPSTASASAGTDAASPSQPQPAGHLTRRTRGRPRKDWAASRNSPTETEQPAADQPFNPKIPASPPDSVLDVAQAELLHHFITQTGPGLAHTDQPDNPIVLFWQHNAPRIGLAVPAVLHLSLSLSAYHLAHLTGMDRAIGSRYRRLAELHLSVGVVKTNKGLSTISPSTCGALYVAAILVCFCTFASGPTGSADLLVCDVGSARPPNRWVSLAKGTRLLSEIYSIDMLFTGLTEPLGPGNDQPQDPRPTCVCEGLTRVDWTAPIDRLRRLVDSCPIPDRQVYLHSFNTLASIYEATFGNDDGRPASCPGRYKMVLIWLYTMEDAYVACLQRMEPIALILLAYYAPLVKTMRRCWFLHDWPQHLLTVMQTSITGDVAEFLSWPIEAVKSIRII